LRARRACRAGDLDPPVEVAYAPFLANEPRSFITGTVTLVDGGKLLSV
jgi:NAD(P)-dependent dehydrogenase (short-subunit alcohol dehydrogenase family)